MAYKQTCGPPGWTIRNFGLERERTSGCVDTEYIHMKSRSMDELSFIARKHKKKKPFGFMRSMPFARCPFIRYSQSQVGDVAMTLEPTAAYVRYRTFTPPIRHQYPAIHRRFPRRDRKRGSSPQFHFNLRLCHSRIARILSSARV